MHKIVNWKLLTFVMACLILVLTACGGDSMTEGNDADSENVKVGLITSFSGTYAKLGDSQKEGFDLYLEQHDDELGGMEVEMTYEDIEGDPKEALSSYRKLTKSDNINIFVGPVSSAVAYALRDKIDQDQNLLLDANAAANDLSWEKKSDYVFRISFSNWQNGTSAADYIANNVGKTAVTIAPDYDAGHEVIESFKPAFEEAGGTVEEELYPDLGADDYATYLQKIAQIDPDIVYTFASGNDAIKLVKQYDEFGLKGEIPLTGSLEFGDVLVTEPTEKASEGIISGDIYFPTLENGVNEEFVKAYEEKYDKTPNIFSVEGYDSAQVLDKAISEADSKDPEDLIKEIKGISIDSPRGSITIDPDTNNPIENFYITENKWIDGKIEPEVIQKVEDVTMPESNPNK